MASDTKILVFIIALLVVAFVMDVNAFQQQSVTLPEDSVQRGDFGSAAVSWWNQRGDLEQNLIIYSVFILFGLLFLKAITRGG